MVRSISQSLSAFAKRFSASRKGNVAMIYGLALFPTVAAIGCGVDMTRALVVKMRLGEALDAAGLAVGGTIGLTQAQLTQQAQQFFYANYPDAELGTVTGLTVATGGDHGEDVSVTGTARVDTAFMGLFGVKYLDVNVNIKVTRATTGIELALVLDNTGSMAQSGKITALKSAATTLVNTLYGNNTTSTTVKMAVVPFSQTVRLDPTIAKNSGWMDTGGVSSTARLNFANPSTYAFSVMSAMKSQPWQGCVEARSNGYEETDTAPTAATPNTLWNPYFEPDGPDGDSNYNDYLTDNVPKAIAKNPTAEQRLQYSPKYTNLNSAGPQGDCNLATLTPLTNNKLTVLNAIAAMVATGNTHIAIGAGWGWRVLSPTPPYTEGTYYGDPLWMKAMVLMTDGLNTTPYNNSFHKSSYTAYNFLVRNQLGTTDGPTSETVQDNRTALVCQRIKDAGIRLYTILLMETSARAQNLMQGCASTDPLTDASAPKCNNDKTKMCYLSPSASQLQSVFTAIGSSLSNLRLSQ